MEKRIMPRTRYQKGRMWATATLFVCMAYSVWANVRSGQFEAENAVTSILPPVVAFLSSHLISYFNPTRTMSKLMIWVGFGLVTLGAMYVSGWHIVEYVMKNGQRLETAIVYVFITDVPMLLAAAILVQKVPTGARGPVADKPPQAASKTPTQAKPPQKRTPPTKKATAKVVVEKEKVGA